MIKTKIYRTVHTKDGKIMYGDYHFDKELVEIHAKALNNLSEYYHYIRDVRIEEANLISYSDDEEVELTPAERELNIIKKDNETIRKIQESNWRLLIKELNDIEK